MKRVEPSNNPAPKKAGQSGHQKHDDQARHAMGFAVNIEAVGIKGMGCPDPLHRNELTDK